jgi:anti-sigma regulatory factor (Ser/Thr protein kinase)
MRDLLGPPGSDAVGTAFSHEALFYPDLTSQLDAVCGFVTDGDGRSDKSLVMLSARKVEAVRGALGSASSSVLFVVSDGESDNPARLIPTWRSFVDSLQPGCVGRGVCEPVVSGMSDPVLSESQIHESLLNVAFGGDNRFRLLCTYDLSLGEPTLEQARRNHRSVADLAATTRRTRHSEKSEVHQLGVDSLWDAPGDAQRFDVDVNSVGTARKALYEFAHAFGMSDSASSDCALAGHEVISNSLRHGGGKAHLSIWRDAETLICQVTDSGHFEEPLAGRKRPGETGRSGRGLWIANQLCDLVQIRSMHAGTVVRLHMRRRPHGS